MASKQFSVSDITVSSCDWANFINSTSRIQDAYKWPDGLNIYSLCKQINEHPAAPMVSIPYLFSYFRRRNQLVYPDQDLAICSVNAMVDLHTHLDSLLNYIPSDLSSS